MPSSFCELGINIQMTHCWEDTESIRKLCSKYPLMATTAYSCVHLQCDKTVGRHGPRISRNCTSHQPCIRWSHLTPTWASRQGLILSLLRITLLMYILAPNWPLYPRLHTIHSYYPAPTQRDCGTIVLRPSKYRSLRSESTLTVWRNVIALYVKPMRIELVHELHRFLVPRFK